MGHPTKALLQNTTALRLGLEVYLHLFKRAKDADPANCLPMPAVTRENFGIVTSGPAWHVVVMRATDDEPVCYVSARSTYLTNLSVLFESGKDTWTGHTMWFIS